MGVGAGDADGEGFAVGDAEGFAVGDAVGVTVGLAVRRARRTGCAVGIVPLDVPTWSATRTQSELSAVPGDELGLGDAAPTWSLACDAVKTLPTTPTDRPSSDDSRSDWRSDVSNCVSVVQ